MALFADFRWSVNISLRMGVLEDQLCPGPLFQPRFWSIEYVKCTLPALAATPLQQTWLNGHGWISFTSWMSFMWFMWSFVLLPHLVSVAPYRRVLYDYIDQSLPPPVIFEIKICTCKCYSIKPIHLPEFPSCFSVFQVKRQCWQPWYTVEPPRKGHCMLDLSVKDIAQGPKNYSPYSSIENLREEDNLSIKTKQLN